MQFLKIAKIKRYLVIALIATAASGMVGSYYFYSKYKAVAQNPNLEAERETAALVATLGKLMQLPEGETPTVATISDTEKLKDQVFFKAAPFGRPGICARNFGGL